MLKENVTLFKRSLFVTDLGLTLFSLGVAWHLAPSLGQGHASGGPSLFPSLLLVGGVVGLWGFLLHRMGAYGRFRGATVFQVVRPIVKVVAIGTLVLNVVLLLFHYNRISQLSFLFIFSVFALLSLCGVRMGILVVLQTIRRKGYNYQNLLVVGTGSRARKFAQTLNAHPEWGYRVRGYLDQDPALLGRRITGHPVVGTLEDLPQLLDRCVIDEVVFIVPRSWLSHIEGALRVCEEQGITISIGADLYNLPVAKPVLTEFEGVPMLTYSTTPFAPGKLGLKRAMDVAGAFFLLILGFPFILGIAAAIRLTSPGPVLFRQTRLGLNGRRFTLLKFRTMVDGAHKRREEMAHLNEMTGPVFKLSNDPRVTWVGWFLRRWSLDELPQLINIFKGEMSLVGPRPPLPTEVTQYLPWQKRRLSMRPGLTCLWQVNGRNTIDFEKWVRLDLEYIDKWSLALDCKILGRTLPAVLLGQGVS